MIAIAAIHSDTILRAREGSDSYTCYAEVCLCCPPRCVGIQWAILAICFQLQGILLALIEMRFWCKDLGCFECPHLSIDSDFDVRDKFHFLTDCGITGHE